MLSNFEIFVICLISVLIKIVLSDFTGNINVHDPSMIKSGPCYYIFSTEQGANFSGGNAPIRSLCNDVSTRIGGLFPVIPPWIKNYTKVKPLIWAPDVNFFNGKYYVYYVGSTFGSKNSVIALATADNVVGPYEDKGPVVFTTNADNYNAIDPEIAWTIENGQRTQLWLFFGSFFSGIKVRRLDMNTGLLSTEDTKLYAVARRPPEVGRAVEAPSVAWRNGWYYLFVSFDLCCKGAQSTYNIRVGRSRTITGPYVGKLGVNMLDGGGTLILQSNGSRRGPGGQDIYLDGGIYRMIHHWYDANDNGRAKFNIVDLVWDANDWPSVGSQSQLNYN